MTYTREKLKELDDYNLNYEKEYEDTQDTSDFNLIDNFKNNSLFGLTQMINSKYQVKSKKQINKIVKSKGKIKKKSEKTNKKYKKS